MMKPQAAPINPDLPINTMLTRRAMLRAATAAGVTLISSRVFSAPQKTYWPRGNDWETHSPKDAGMDAAGIEDAIRYAGEHNSTGLVILNNKTNCTWYRSCLRDMSRFGLLILRNGMWESKQLISAKYVKEAASTSQKLNESYGYLWWLNGKASYKLPGGAGGVQSGMLWPDCPPDAFGALGAQDKKIYIVPSLDLVVSRHGGAAGTARTPGAEGGGRSSFDNELLGRICRAVRR